MSAESELERELRAALHERLARPEGRFPGWGMSPASRRALATPVRSRRAALPPLGWVGAAAVVIVCVALGASMLRLAGPAPAGSIPSGSAGNERPSAVPSCAGCGGSVIWAVAAFDEQHVVAVGGKGDASGDLLLLRSSDGGRTWGVEHPNAPVLTSLAVAGDRLYGSSECLPKYPPDYALPSDAHVQSGPGVDLSFHPAPASCLYYSDDRGATWHDTGAGRLVDPSFADPMNGWAHAPYDALGKTATTLYSTVDGGRTWHTAPTPCDSRMPWIRGAIATGPGTGYLLCIGPTDDMAEPPQEADWELLQIRPGSAPIQRLGSRTAGMPANTGAGGFFMRADGTGWVYTETTGPAQATGGAAYVQTYSIYRTGDGGQLWDRPQDASTDWPGAQSVSFVTATNGFAAFRSLGSWSGVMATTNGGRTWSVLAAWGWWTFEPISVPGTPGHS